MRRLNPSTRVINIVLGIALILVGVWLMFDFLIKFFAFVIGMILVSSGFFLLMKKWRR